MTEGKKEWKEREEGEEMEKVKREKKEKEKETHSPWHRYRLHPYLPTYLPLSPTEPFLVVNLRKQVPFPRKPGTKIVTDDDDNNKKKSRPSNPVTKA